MKKILLFLLLSIAGYGQIVPTGGEQDFDYGIRNTASQLDDNAAFITVQDATGVQGKSTSSVWAKKIYVDNADATKSFLSTGLIKNGLVTTNADPTKFNITAGIGIITNFDNPEVPTSTIVSFPAFTNISSPYLNTSNITYVAITLSGSTPVVLMQATAFDNVQRRNVIALGAVIHSNLTTINLVNNISAPTNAGTNQLHDLYEFIGALNLTGNKYTANGANLSLDKTAGTIGKLGVNFANNWRDPNRLTIGLQTLLTFRYRTQNGTEGSDVTTLNPAVYDLANVLTAVPSNKFSIQTVTLFQTGMTRIQYGQNVYNTLAEAEAAILTRSYVVENNIAMNGIARAYIILKNTATSLQNASDAKIIEAQKFGGIVSGGAAITDSAIIAALGYTPENVANKSDSYTASSSTTYASTKAVVDGLGTKIGGTGTVDFIPKFGTGGLTLGNSMLSDVSGEVILKQNSDILGFIIKGFTASSDAFKVFISNVGTATVSGTKALIFGSGSSSSIVFRPGSGGIYFNDTNSSNSFFNTIGGKALIGTTTDDGINKLQVNGSTKTTALTLTTTPTTSAGTYDFLTRNTSTGVVEKVLSNTIATIASPSFTGTPTAPTATVGTNTTQIATTAFVQSTTNNNAVLITGDQTKAGILTFSANTTFAKNNGISLTNSGPSSSNTFSIINTSAGLGTYVYNQSTGTGNYVLNEGSGYGFHSLNNTGAGDGFISESFGGSTGRLFVGKLQGVGDVFAVDKNGVVAAAYFKPTVYTVATLPTPTGTAYATVSDALAPTYMTTVVGGGAVVTPVFYNGTNWVAH